MHGPIGEKTMKKKIIAILLSAYMLLTACTTDTTQNSEGTSDPDDSQIVSTDTSTESGDVQENKGSKTYQTLSKLDKTLAERPPKLRYTSI